MGREEEQLRGYILETLRYIQTVKNFCDSEQQWTLQRKAELQMMRDIKTRADKFFGRFRKQKLEKELEAVLENTLKGLEKLQHFLDAVEKLAVTSPFVFIDKILLLKGVSNEAVQFVISTAKIMSPLLIHFKRDDGAFFFPWLGNVEVLVFQLDKYIHITRKLYAPIRSKGALENIDIQKKVSSVSLKDMIGNLSRIRMDESFRMSFLFHGKIQHFIKTYSECCPRMLQSLLDLEETAVELDKMKKGSSISTVAGSSVGAVGGVFSIVGLALAPFTAGVSLGLTLTGVVLGVTSAANSLVTGATELGVNKHHGDKANEIFQRFMKDMQNIQDHLEQVASQCPLLHLDEGEIIFRAGRVVTSAASIIKGVDAIVDGASAVETLSSAANVGVQEAKAARNIPNLAADLPDIGRLAKGTPLALSKAARAGFITLNALFIGVDVALICKESMSLAKGEKSEASQLIRYRSALWCSEIVAWDKIYNCLCKGSKTFQDDLAILEQSFTIWND